MYWNGLKKQPAENSWKNQPCSRSATLPIVVYRASWSETFFHSFDKNKDAASRRLLLMSFTGMGKSIPMTKRLRLHGAKKLTHADR
jgi:hypothetical protein